MSEHTSLGAGAEFDLVRALVARFGPAAAGIGDDAGVVTAPAGEVLLVSTDLAVEDEHFRRGWITPEEIGYRSTTAALSDLAAMAAVPRGIVVALTLPERWRSDACALADGIARAARQYAAPIVGGDLSDGAALAIAVTVLGSTTRPLTRSGARAGDVVWVTGKLGGAGQALAAFERGEAPLPEARERFAAPRARVLEARWLATHGATAAIDISDGLVGDLGHMAAASAVCVRVELDQLPVHAGVTPEAAAASGEEYELAITGPATLDGAAFAREFGLSLTRVGSVESAGADGPRVIVTRDGVPTTVVAAGFSHFSR